MEATYINQILSSVKEVVDMCCGEDIQKGNPYIKNSPYTADDISVNIGVTGDLKGQIVIALQKDIVKYLAGQMMGGMQITDIEMAKSAVGELGNMVMGTAAIKLSQIQKTVDITPPMILEGKVNISNPQQTITIPFKTKNDMKFEVNVSIGY
ncbi:chemotaxis protein CheX [Alkalithermobacter thermoalcaliphilus JW-YL-7 = DSM 7308]|uniref:Chemotaxis protein CheX n=1 Tax=Alkalithermobacter thermoalcaliphilus JW-YL-7 = DSM 7308 TaxID=1121328 RepID=A0A150FQ22_CLOPD|nr:putative chemotaxis phosphatase, CheX [[Clostridium] paradoxum JW-YL-7 = DSM 7308]SHK63721.1 chemotaxis protein CheX [[Clostridium] paradoxum JW-YL-7 = DSM 7308]